MILWCHQTFGWKILAAMADVQQRRWRVSPVDIDFMYDLNI
jgi:hypothetical protein